MSGVITAVAVVGAAGAAYSANSAKKSQDKATAQNAQNVADTNAMNKQMFDESRGSTGHAFLPTYTGDAEKQTFNDLYGIYQSGLTPEQRQAQAQEAMAAMAPAIQGGNQFLTDAYSGQNLATTRGYYQPLWDARTQTAQAQADAIQQAYARARQQNLATNMKQGYYGGSSWQSREAQKNTLDALQQAALAKGNAQIQNATEGAQVGVADLANRQQLLNEPLSRAQSLINYQNLASNAAYTGYDQLANRLGMYNIGKGQYTYQSAPVVQPNINSGQVVGSALSALGSTLGNYYMNQQQPTYINAAHGGTGLYNLAGSGAGYTGGGTTGAYNVTPSSTSTINFGGLAS